jgi:hypothetical protein
VRKTIGVKVFLTLIGVLAVVFYDTTLPVINAVIQLKINILGFFLEPLLQWAFDLPLRQAQMVSAWIYLIFASILFWYLFVKSYKALLATFFTARHAWLAKNRRQKIKLIILVVLLIIALVKLSLIFL